MMSSMNNSPHVQEQMDNLGKGMSDKKQNDATRRIRRGQCPTCGEKTRKINPITRKKTKLTVENKVLYGICLKCNPIEGYVKRASRPPIPRNIVVTSREEDDETVVSGMTVELSTIMRKSRKPWSRGAAGNDKIDEEDEGDSIQCVK